MIRFEGKKVIDKWVEVFGSSPTIEQLKFMIKIVKHCRGRCRNNAALKNYLNRSFTSHKFVDVDKIYKGETYKGLEIIKK